MDPNQQPPNRQDNPYIPPPPGSGVQQQQNQVQPQQQVQQPQQSGLEVDHTIAKKKRQARFFLIAAGVFAVLFVIGIIFLISSAGSSNGGDGVVDRNTEEQLKFDTNRLGLAVINYNLGNAPFEITPNTAAELRVAYIVDEFNDPRTNEPYTLVTTIPEVGEMQYVIGGICNGDDSVSQSGDDKNFAIRVLLEEEGTLYCLERSEVEQFTAPPNP